MNKSIVRLDNVEPLLDRYKTFLVDQFGVLHDGFKPYQGAASALRKIKASGARVIIISNSGKRAIANIKRMNSLGFDEQCFDRLVTSGEVAWHLLQKSFIGQRFPNGANCFFLSNNNDRSAVEGLQLTEVDDLHKAQLILLSGQHLKDEGLNKLCGKLSVALKHEVPCICTNPDKVAYAESGKVFSSGTVADWYESQGGEVIWLGKPYPEIYEYILEVENISGKNDVICVGDSVEHDIVGGSGQGLDTLLVRTGINDHLTDEEMSSVYLQHGRQPDFIIDQLK